MWFVDDWNRVGHFMKKYMHVSAYAVKENRVIGPWNNIQQKFGIEIHPTALTYAQLVGDSMHSFGSARASAM